MDKKGSTFGEFNTKYPCKDCSAPCCRYLIIPHKAPMTWMEMDYIRYILNFPEVNVTVSKNGDWGILLNKTCIHYDMETQNCKIHGTPAQPKTCSYFNPFQCNYRLNLEKSSPQNIYILDREKFENWIQYVKFDENGKIIDGPSYEKSVEIIKN